VDLQPFECRQPAHRLERPCIAHHEDASGGGGHGAVIPASRLGARVRNAGGRAGPSGRASGTSGATQAVADGQPNVAAVVVPSHARSAPDSQTAPSESSVSNRSTCEKAYARSTPARLIWPSSTSDPPVATTSP